MYYYCMYYGLDTLVSELIYKDLYSSIPDDEFGERTVSILLDGEESEMIFIDHPSAEMSVSRIIMISHFNLFWLNSIV